MTTRRPIDNKSSWPLLLFEKVKTPCRKCVGETHAISWNIQGQTVPKVPHIEEARSQSSGQCQQSDQKSHIFVVQDERSPNAVLFSEREDCEDWAEHLVEEAGVKTWKLLKGIYKRKGRIFFRQILFMTNTT